eukprot:scaffold295635_cov71-Attheya_sp.AAC.4
MDSFAYMTSDTLAAGADVRTNGIILLVPAGIDFQAAVHAPVIENLEQLPGVSQQSAERAISQGITPEKYVIGETYSSGSLMSIV